MMVSNALPKPPPGIIKCPSCGKPLVYKKFKNPFGGPDYEFPCLDCDCKNREDSFKKVEARAKAAGIPKKFRHEDLSDWKVIPGTERLYSAGTTYAKNLKKNIAEGIGCIFVSKGFGTGKSKMVHYIQVEAIKAGIQTYSITSKSLMERSAGTKSGGSMPNPTILSGGSSRSRFSYTMISGNRSRRNGIGPTSRA